jgi:ADP-dependent phosphofructokinase/glucokinase
MSGSEDARLYDALAGQLGALARSARLTLAGFGCCVDYTLDLAQIAPALLQDPDIRARRFGDEMRRRAAAGIGGELCVDWPEGPGWLDRHCGMPPSLGGTAAQAANMLAALGAPVLLALQDRSARQLSLIHPDVLVAAATGPCRTAELPAETGHARLPHYIFEYARGIEIAGVVPARATRIIVRFEDDGMDDDPAFVARSMHEAPRAGAAILAGFNSVPPAQLDAQLAAATDIVGAWRAAGVRWVHLELGDFPNLETRDRVLAGLRGIVTSLGMNASESRALVPGAESAEARALALADRMAVARVCIHADDWALTVTRADPAQERVALLVGCLLASTRAQRGQIAVPTAAPPGAIYAAPPPASTTAPAGWHVVRCAAPYLEHPRSTLGLGDTFLAGTLLVLGQANPVAHDFLPLTTEN